MFVNVNKKVTPFTARCYAERGIAKASRTYVWK